MQMSASDPKRTWAVRKYRDLHKRWSYISAIGNNTRNDKIRKLLKVGDRQ
jgi:hypothetical protein